MLRYFGFGVTLALLFLSTVIANAQSLKDRLVGSWSLVSADAVRPDGTRTELFGPNPKGMVIYTSDGRFALLSLRGDLLKIASSNRARTTAEEAQAIVAGSIGYFGRYTLDEANKVITADIEASTFANQVGGTDAKRVITSITAKNSGLPILPQRPVS
jgi:hypothetical protein